MVNREAKKSIVVNVYAVREFWDAKKAAEGKKFAQALP
jgi:hypothetical protein